MSLSLSWRRSSEENSGELESECATLSHHRTSTSDLSSDSDHSGSESKMASVAQYHQNTSTVVFVVSGKPRNVQLTGALGKAEDHPPVALEIGERTDVRNNN